MERVTESLIYLGEKNIATDLIHQVLHERRGKELGPERESMFLSYIAQSLVLIGDNHKAIQIVDEAIEVVKAQAIGDDRARTGVLSEMAQTLARIGEFNQAITIALGPTGKHDQITVLLKIYETLLQLSEKTRALEVMEHALAIAKAIRSKKARTKVLSEIAQTLIQVEEYEEALAVGTLALKEFGNEFALFAAVKLIPSSATIEQLNHILHKVDSVGAKGAKGETLNKLAQALARAGDYELALKMANKIVNKNAKEDEQTGEMAQISKGKGESEVPSTITGGIWVPVEEVLMKVYEDEGIVHYETILRSAKSNALFLIVQLLAGEGKYDRALTVADMIEDSRRNTAARRVVAQHLAKAGKYTLALTVADMIADSGQATAARSAVAQALSQAGDKDIAKEIAEKAMAELLSLEYSVGDIELEAVSISWRNVIEVLAYLKDIDPLLAVLKEIRNPDYKSYVLKIIAHSMIGAGELGLVLTLASQTENDWDKQNLIDLAVQTVLDEKDLALLLIAVESIRDPAPRAVAFANAASTLMHLKRSKEAQQVFHNSLITACQAGRHSLFKVLEKGIVFLPNLEQDHHLWTEYEAIVEADEWWGCIDLSLAN